MDTMDLSSMAETPLSQPEKTQIQHNGIAKLSFNELNESVEVVSESSSNLQNIEQEVENINQVLQNFSKGFKFKYNEVVEAYQVSIINKQTGEIVKEIPSEEFIKLAEKIHQTIATLIDQYS